MADFGVTEWIIFTMLAIGVVGGAFFLFQELLQQGADKPKEQ